MSYFQTTNDLINAFGDIDSSSFYGQVALADTPIGFSVKKRYPQDIRYKPAVRQDNKEPDNVAAIWVVYLAPKSSSENPALVPLRVRIALMSQYRATNWDYNFSDIKGGCPSKESLEASLATPQPIDLTFEGEYFFDHSRNAFIDARGTSYTGAQLLQPVFEEHCYTVHWLKGLKLRSKLMLKGKAIGVLSLLIQLTASFLKSVFGRTIESSEMLAGLYMPYKWEAFKKLNQHSIDLLGYKASKHVIVLFCSLVVLLAIAKYNAIFTNGYVDWLLSNQAILAVHGIFALWLLDAAIPWGLFLLINMMLRLKNIIFMNLSSK